MICMLQCLRMNCFDEIRSKAFLSCYILVHMFNMNSVAPCHPMVDSSSNHLQACTGNMMVARCQKSRNLLEQSLCQIQSWVPVILVAEVCQFPIQKCRFPFSLNPRLPFDGDQDMYLYATLHQ